MTNIAALSYNINNTSIYHCSNSVSITEKVFHLSTNIFFKKQFIFLKKTSFKSFFNPFTLTKIAIIAFGIAYITRLLKRQYREKKLKSKETFWNVFIFINFMTLIFIVDFIKLLLCSELKKAFFSFVNWFFCALLLIPPLKWYKPKLNPF